MCELIRTIQFKIIFTNPINCLDFLINKQINLEQILNNEEDNIILSQLLQSNTTNKFVLIELENDNRLIKSKFVKKYKFLNDIFFSDIRFLELNNSTNKYDCIKKIYEKIIKNKNLKKMYNYYLFQFKNISYDEFEYEIDLMLEEFKLFLDKFEFDEDEKKIINAFVLDDNIKSNIKFIGWEDFVN